MKIKKFFAFLLIYAVVFITCTMFFNYYTDNFIITPLKRNITVPYKISYLIYELKPKIIVAEIIGQLEIGLAAILSLCAVKLIERSHH